MNTGPNLPRTPRLARRVTSVGAETPANERSFYSVSQTARLLGMSQMTLYRAISAGEFPAVRIRGRLIVPARAIEQMVDAALYDGALVDAAAWVRPAADPLPTEKGAATAGFRR
jgi:excisionase family DNA binding protein